MLLEKLTEQPFCIYGAGIVATSVYTAIKALYEQVPLFFLVSDQEAPKEKQSQKLDKNPLQIDGIPVKRLSEWKKEVQKHEQCMAETETEVPILYLVAVPEIHHSAILEALCTLSVGEENIFLLTNQQENELMEEYYSKSLKQRTVRAVLAEQSVKNNTNYEYSIFERRKAKSVSIYQAKSHMDKPVQSHFDSNSYIYPIQVGAALTDQVITTLRDDIGENISSKNRNYCELTASYYAWKHSDSSYKGICHYRRLFDISEEQMQRMLECESEWDVILPYPSVHYPDISSQHLRYVNDKDWGAMLQALGELEPEYLDAYRQSVSAEDRFFYNYNMLIAKSNVFDNYCNFLFRILGRTEELVTPRGWERADRFAGYLGENLTTIYFLKNREKWKILYAGKTWLT